MNEICLRNKIENGEFISAPGVHDMIAASLVRSIGFDAVYASGYWMGASSYGVPDVGITTYTQMVDRVGTLVKTMEGTSAIMADADTGYGGLINVRETVRGYEAAGAQVIQIEDQEFPKKCGHTKNKRVVSLETMVDKIKVAVDSKTSSKTMIAARTDARQGEGFESVMRRMEAYSKAGADILFPEALEGEAEMKEACEILDKPILVNMANGGNTPIMTGGQLAELGVSLAIYPAVTALAATHAIKNSLLSFKRTGTSENDEVPMFDFGEFCSLIGFDEIWEFEARWAEK